MSNQLNWPQVDNNQVVEISKDDQNQMDAHELNLECHSKRVEHLLKDISALHFYLIYKNF